MAYQTKIEKYQKEFPEAYFVISNILWRSTDDEVYKNIDESSEKVEYVKVEQSSAIVDVYADRIARENRVSPIHSVKIPFEYDKDSDLNIIQQAYGALKEIEEFKDGIDV